MYQRERWKSLDRDENGIRCPACRLVIPVHHYGLHVHLDVAGVPGAESCHVFEVCSVIVCVCVVLTFKLGVG